MIYSHKNKDTTKSSWLKTVGSVGASTAIGLAGGYLLLPAAAGAVGGAMAVSQANSLMPSMFMWAVRQHASAQAYNFAMAWAPQASTAIAGLAVKSPAILSRAFAKPAKPEQKALMWYDSRAQEASASNERAVRIEV